MSKKDPVARAVATMIVLALVAAAVLGLVLTGSAGR